MLSLRAMGSISDFKREINHISALVIWKMFEILMPRTAVFIASFEYVFVFFFAFNETFDDQSCSWFLYGIEITIHFQATPFKKKTSEKVIS